MRNGDPGDRGVSRLGNDRRRHCCAGFVAFVGSASLYGGLIAANVMAWTWAWVAFHDRPALLGIALLAWVFGLRYAVDADHIAAIDNVVRKLITMGSARRRSGYGSRLATPALSFWHRWRLPRRRRPCRTGSTPRGRSAAWSGPQCRPRSCSRLQSQIWSFCVASGAVSARYGVAAA